MRYKRHPKRDAIKNYFPLPNKIFALRLSAGEISVYSYLLYLENRKTFQCWPSYNTIGKAVAMSQNTVRKYVMALEEKALIRTEPTSVYTKSGQKRNGSLLYTIRPIQEALDLFYERQMAQAELAAQR
ncbi:MAG: helix-turn-helix domain-containing protein [Eubacteriales bacterium]|nr:helix-turn-helix domain-containing protein [Eubacteriales bacterium]